MSRKRRPPAPGPRGRAETPAEGSLAAPPGEPPADDPVARAILELLETVPPGRSISPVAAARAFALSRARPGDPPDAWRRYLPAVRQQALHLARAAHRDPAQGQAGRPPRPFQGRGALGAGGVALGAWPF